jgi:hypothetical protein
MKAGRMRPLAPHRSRLPVHGNSFRNDPQQARESRAQALAWAKRSAAACTMAAIVLAVWALFRPHPYDLIVALLAALPPLALIAVLARRSLFRIGLGTGYEANLGTACAAPACALFARTLFDLNPVGWLPLTSFAAAVALVFFITASRRETNLARRWWRLLIAALLTGAYAFGALGQADVLLDRAPQSVLRSRIIDKQLGHTRIATYHLTLAPWGALTQPIDASVPRRVYDQAEIGDPACIHLHDGALGIAWFSVVPCR